MTDTNNKYLTKGLDAGLKTAHKPSRHYLFRKFIGVLIIDHLIKGGSWVAVGSECLFTNALLVSAWFGDARQSGAELRVTFDRSENVDFCRHLAFRKRSKNSLTEPNTLGSGLLESQWPSLLHWLPEI